MKTSLIFLIFINFCLSSYSMEINVGISDKDYYPYYFEKDNKMYGASIEIAEQLANKLGHNLIYKRYPFARVINYISSGEIDMVILYIKSKEREKYAHYLDIPHIYESSSIIYKKTRDEIFFEGNLNKLKKYNFANVRGYSHGATYDNATFLSKTFVKNETQLIKVLLAERIDIAIGNKAVIYSKAKELGVQNEIIFHRTKIDDGPCYLAFSKKSNIDKEVITSFNNSIKEFVKSEKYKSILKKYNFL
ncbi:hypothetical protein A9Q84_14360 [Halobacteriovorax marinus]|uniref:Solute-binding protein family 3/N-terminal domain-containing protein n=1 Tax=Halobacteriovorax marinus TaxID=97084 RepID=A0A1Y5F4V0_9BACT|nr:hypothetical protein A9Q84_14360 [Halobacteriovorax marinus]